jgi:D-alanyl-D-alanine dipeptidase
VDDSRSLYYNRIVDATLVRPDWSSSEEMLRKDMLYRFGIVIEHNVNPVIAGRGSCIFLHIWEGAKNGTSGCTAISVEDMEMLLLWLIPEAKPILVQLPDEEYTRVRKAWDLP